MCTVKVKKLSSSAILPSYAHPGDTGADLYANIDTVIEPGKSCAIPTGIAVAFPENVDMQIRSRSGLAANRQVFVLNSPGTVDSGYRGEVCVILFNAGEKPFEVKKGDKIAQAVFSPCYTAKFDLTDELDETERGTGGFGSTDKYERLRCGGTTTLCTKEER